MKRPVSLALGLLLNTSCCIAASSAAPVSMEALDWDIPAVIYWSWVNGAICNSSGGGYIYSRVTPYAHDFTGEASITPREKRSNSRAEAALALVSVNRRHIWRLALVEDQGKRFADLKLLLSSREADESHARIQYREGADFQWEFNQEYRLRLRNEPGKVTGEVWADDGKLLCRIVAEPSEKVKPIPLGFSLYTTALCSEFREPKAAWSNPAPPVARVKPAMRRPRYQSPANTLPGFNGEATGYFHVKQAPDGRWHLIDPLGKSFFACGIDRLYMDGRFCEALGYAPYLRNMQKQFGSWKAWADHTMDRVRSWGFCYATTADTGFYDRFPFSVNLMVGSSFAAFGDDYNICPYLGRVGTALPNPFHPRFEEWAKRCYMDWAERETENPYFVGYFCDNELRWRGANFSQDGSGVFDTVLKKRAGHLAKEALVDFLKKRFGGDVERFNKFWRTNLKAFNELETRTELVHGNPEQLQVKLDFLSLVADTYFKRVRQALREVDPNHMLLGGRFAGIVSAPDQIWEIAGKYCDIVSFNQYPIADFEQNKLWAGAHPLRAEFDRVAKLCKRPMMITEWSVLGLDSGLPCEFGAGQRLRTQTERARAAELFLRTMLSMPYMVGMSWYQYTDDPKLGVRKAHPESCNFGLVSETDVPYSELLSMFTRIQNNIGAVRQKGAPPELPPESAGALYAGFTSPLQTAALKTAKKSGAVGVANDTLELRVPDSGACIDLLLGGEKYGSLQMMAQCVYDGNKRVWPKAEKIALIKSERRTGGTVLFFTSVCRSVAGELEIDTRVLLPQQGAWIIADITAVRNIGNRAVKLLSVAFQTPPAFVPVMQNAYFPTDYLYLKDAEWRSESGRYLGAAASLSRIQFHFYRDKEGTLHPDGVHPVEQRIDPGKTWKPAYPCYAFFFCGNDGDSGAMTKELLHRDLAPFQTEKEK